jgi:glucose-1-phosphate cytidylyltransferase
MKAVILAGGLGTRLSEETEARPKPMVEVGGQPLLWHIMKNLEHFGLDQFVIALGYKGELVKSYFRAMYEGDLHIDLRSGEKSMKVEAAAAAEPWSITLAETGLTTNTGGRLQRLRDHLDDEPFLLTYGDGLADVDIAELMAFHASHNKLVTVTAVRPPARFGGLEFAPRQPATFVEKPRTGEGWINGGFMILDPEVVSYVEGPDTSLEFDVLERLSKDGQMMAFAHEGFWQCIDTLRELRGLRSMWDDGTAPWKNW